MKVGDWIWGDPHCACGMGDSVGGGEAMHLAVDATAGRDGVVFAAASITGEEGDGHAACRRGNT